MNQTESKLEVGKEYRYEEDGGAERIKIIDAKIENGMLIVEFEVLEVLEDSPIADQSDAVGKTFSACKTTDAYCPSQFIPRRFAQFERTVFYWGIRIYE